MNRKVYSQLSIMMFLQIGIWGAWFVTLGSYLANIGFSGTEIGTAYLTNNIGAIIAPLFVGLVADRFFPAEKVMAILHLMGAAVLYYVSGMEGTNNIILGLLIYNACYMPTLALANSVSFYQLDEPDAQFPRIRVWGTIGWIVAGLGITFVLGTQVENVEATSVPMKMAAAGSVILGLFSFTLPNTPPKSKGKKVTIGDVLGLESFALMKDKSFAIFAISSLLISIPLAFYYSFANLYLNEIGMEGVAAKMTMGQMSEAVFLVIMPFFFRRLGVKWMLLVGMLAWVVRYGLFATGDMDSLAALVYLGIILHGVCYDFFFVTGQIYVDNKAAPEIRSSAQSFIALLTYGVGLAIGTATAGRVVDAFTTDGVRDWTSIWMTPCVFALVIAIFFMATFKNEKLEGKAEAAAE
ncbi:nucleoside permease [Pseudemcibacter aquimaris]|uniref:nucleoside permease n=1 Tax=Pseudemcibacter aquimaris TaxID=2857064 RepID=UPI00201180DE|nr:nucleoside permease [Pseudemcibacter aquimaris]MCC3862568.1 nucleoside permease [Pseudemcibacter aquimaris]WDU57914.1 nucleoside permease [Pseudemcibacter aquimaris]